MTENEAVRDMKLWAAIAALAALSALTTILAARDSVRLTERVSAIEAKLK